MADEVNQYYDDTSNSQQDQIGNDHHTQIEVDAPVPVQDLSEEEVIREQKQTYLYVQIVDQGFDTDKFAEFMNSKKGNT